MIDYLLHLAALKEFNETLAGEAIADPAVADERDQDVAAAEGDPASAALGALLQHVVWQASSDGTELELLEEASALWDDGLALYDALGRFRASLERILNEPSDADGVAEFNVIGEELRALVPKVVDQDKRIDKLRERVVTFDHLKPHPRQEDRPPSEWSWADLLLGRRTDAFVRELVGQARGEGARAFGVGALSAYGADAAGSMYLGQVVGGPRRAHRFRDRLARNTVGSWIGQEWPEVPTPAAAAELLEQASLPTEAVSKALENTYPTDSLPPIPDLKLGQSRVVRHLGLLDGFRFPAAPEPPGEPFLTLLFGDPSNSYTPTMPETTGLTESGQGPTPTGGLHPLSGVGTDDGPDHSEPPGSTEVKCGAFWEALGESVLFLLGGWFYCVVRWTSQPTCSLWEEIKENWSDAFPGGVEASAEFSSGADPQQLTTDQAAVLAQREEMTQLVGDLHNMQSMMWEGFQKAGDFLALYGLIYPTPFLDRWRYAQYLSAHAAEWPYLPDDGSRFDEWPETTLELPLGEVGYPGGSGPSVILTGPRSAGTISLQIWSQIADGSFDADNLDLDADRGWRHPCWTPQGSITDQPIDVRILDYTET